MKPDRDNHVREPMSRGAKIVLWVIVGVPALLAWFWCIRHIATWALGLG